MMLLKLSVGSFFLSCVLTLCLLIRLSKVLVRENTTATAAVVPAPSRPQFRPSTSPKHPIQVLAEESELHFNALLKRQSHTIEKAIAEYRRRYSRDPPPGFEHWVEYAIAEESPIIDEFDTLDRAIAPLLRIDGDRVQDALREARDAPDAAVWSCKFENHRLKHGCEGLGEDNLRLLADARILANLPDVEMLINGLDEPRVLSSGWPSSRVKRNPEQAGWIDSSHQNVWKEVVENPCREQRTRRAVRDNDGGLPLMRDMAAAMDLCQHPEYEHMHGLWDAPVTLKTTTSPVPVLSPATISTMGDIPFPAVAYNNPMYSYNADEDMAWENKTAGLYWAGKTTGGFIASGPAHTWKQQQRERFVRFANQLDPLPHTYLERHGEDDARWEPVTREFLNASSYHVYFTDVVQCEDEAACDGVRDYFDIHAPDDRRENLQYSLAMDVDGNGHSARYYRLLHSRSLPLKQTIFQEWHDDRLQPWLHYVPVSMGMEELPEVVRYLVEEEEGRVVASELAIKGREWAAKGLRPVDEVIYLYRLMLELARVEDPTRKGVVSSSLS
jgi:hypothetical protein